MGTERKGLKNEYSMEKIKPVGGREGRKIGQDGSNTNGKEQMQDPF